MGSLTIAGSGATAPQHTDTEVLQRPHVVLLASPGAGHLIPLAELARRLVEHHGFAATLVTYTNFFDPRLLQCIPASVSTVALPAIQIDNQLTTNGPVGNMLRELGRLSLPDLRKLLRSMISPTSPAPLAALVPDFFCVGALPIAAELGVPGYLFFPGSLSWIALTRHIVELHDNLPPGEYYRDVAEPLELPGPLSLRRADLPESCRDCNEPSYQQSLEWGRLFRGADGLLVNTFSDMEPAAVEAFALAAKQGAFPPVFPVGPSIRSSSDSDQVPDNSTSPCLEWLDRQPTGSVVYVSFGSGGALSVEQTVELAAGLEASGQRFLWIVRMPRMEGRHPFAFGNHHSHGDGDDPLAWLPEGFLERTKSRGLAVAAWAPQVRVLSHPATAAFVSHCGWNSTLESVQSGVPIVALPLCADQRMNAVMLEVNLGAALCPPRGREDGGGVVAREEITAAVNEIVEGEKGSVVKRRARDLQKAATDAWSHEGSSSRALKSPPPSGRWRLAPTGEQVG